MDSLDVVEFIVAIEEDLKIDLNEEQQEKEI